MVSEIKSKIGTVGPKLLRWMGASAAQAGRRHVAHGKRCEDVALVSIGDDVAVIVVSDGAGSARYSAEGAAVIAQTTVDLLRRMTPWTDDVDAVKLAILTACIAEMNKRASVLGCQVRELAATLAFVAANQERFIAGNLGDGLVVAAPWDSIGIGGPHVLIGQDRGEFVNETVFLTSAEAIRRFSVVQGQVDSYDGFVVMSDGAADRLFKRSDGTLAPLVDRLFSSFEEMTSNDVVEWLGRSVMPVMMTQDDYSLGILRRVRVAADSFEGRGARFQMEILGVKNRTGLENRIRVMRCCVAGKTRTRDICDATGLSEVSARRHRRALKAILV